jgi:hypothetical protein
LKVEYDGTAFRLCLQIQVAALQHGAAVDPPPHGKAVQVDHIKPTLKAPGINFLTLKYDEALSIFAFNFNLRRYITALCEDIYSMRHAREFVLEVPPPRCCPQRHS